MNPIAAQVNPDGMTAYLYADGDVVTETDKRIELYPAGHPVPELDRGDAPEPDHPGEVLVWRGGEA